MRPKYTNVWARSAKVGAEQAGSQSAALVQRVFWLMSWSFVVFSLLRFDVGRTRRASEILRPNLLNIELREALAHCLQNIFERWRFALDLLQLILIADNICAPGKAQQSVGGFLFQQDYGSVRTQELAPVSPTRSRLLWAVLPPLAVIATGSDHRAP